MSKDAELKPYLCYIHRAGRSVADLTLVVCESDRAVAPAIDRLRLQEHEFVRIEVYDRERRVMVRHGRAAA